MDACTVGSVGARESFRQGFSQDIYAGTHLLLAVVVDPAPGRDSGRQFWDANSLVQSLFESSTTNDVQTANHALVEWLETASLGQHGSNNRVCASSLTQKP